MNTVLLILIFSLGSPSYSVQLSFESEELCETEKSRVAEGVHQALLKSGNAQVAVTMSCAKVMN